ncbi:16S rRNA (guanine(527)-N(7))-methyltransferase RsmG [Agaribacter flavus]|uniref:Ribosomal RNA small subunit methyltransferase G n=1 Tax=Agaribacter flavus TaxID=1902781 RepID=A0ABV7FRI1_9ALTE
MTTDLTQLREQLDVLINRTALTVTEEQRNKLVRFVGLLDKWNKTYNLSSVRKPSDMLVKHIMDSIVVAPYVEGKYVADIGTGPGLPGIPLAIMLPEKEFTLLDSLGKRIRFIKQVLHELDISNVTPIQSRVETFQASPLFECILSRAFASMSDMLNWCEHLVSDNGYFLALKGQLHPAELSQIDARFFVEKTTSLDIPSLEGERHLVKIKKL